MAIEIRYRSARGVAASQGAGVSEVGQRRAIGKPAFVPIRREGIEDLRHYLDGFWSDVLSAYGAEIAQRMKE